jgi:DNA-binding transcriptional regulator YiaG
MMHGRRSNYRYAECGLDTVNLVNVTVFECVCGAIVPEIPNVSELHRQIVFSLINKPTLLTGDEIKFLRKMADLSAGQLAQLLGTHNTNLSKWENGSRRITKKTDCALRLLCFAGMLQQLVKDQTIVPKDLVPKVAEAVKQLSEVDIKKILQSVKAVVKGPMKVTINPEELAKYSSAGVSHQGNAALVH